MRNTFVETLDEMAERNPKVMCVIGDTGFSVFEGFEKKYGPRFVNVGIAEQNFVSFGAGLAAMGMKPYIYNVVSFMTLRSMEQIVLDICYQENPVVMVGVGGGHAYGPAGPTHHSYFDIGMMRMMPGLTVVCPADPVEMKAVMLASENYDKPMYIRIGRSVDPVIHDKPIDFQIGKGILMREGKEVALLATGTMVKDTLLAADMLKENGIQAAVYSIPTIKPMDEELVKECAQKYSVVITIEEHSAGSGLGAAVQEVYVNNGCVFPKKFKKLGFPDQFAPCTGTREYLNGLYGISPEKIAMTVSEMMETI